MSMPAVRAQALTKSYGRTRARGIIDVDLTLAPGQVLGLVGANGAGKTTLMRTMLDFIRPTGGSVQLLGLDSRSGSVAIRHRTTYLPGELVFPARLNGLDVVGRYLSERGDLDLQRVKDLAADFELDLDRPVGDLSKGNRQKLGLLLAFAPSADLLILDEPTSGLDPLLQRQFAALVADATDRGAAVLLSSHVMAEVEQVAGSVALMRDGKIVTIDTLAAILARGVRRGQARPRTRDAAAMLEADLRRTAGISDVSLDAGTDGHPVVRFALAGDVNPMLAILSRHELDGFDLGHADLEDAFFHAVDPGSS
jgi:ABC-2 type transport system ATP-binding protein